MTKWPTVLIGLILLTACNENQPLFSAGRTPDSNPNELPYTLSVDEGFPLSREVLLKDVEDEAIRARLTLREPLDPLSCLPVFEKRNGKLINACLDVDSNNCDQPRSPVTLSISIGYDIFVEPNRLDFQIYFLRNCAVIDRNQSMSIYVPQNFQGEFREAIRSALTDYLKANFEKP
jgi:hypothetical protein